MDKEMQVDSDSDEPSIGFTFSNPNTIANPEKIHNFGGYSDNIFGGRTTRQSDSLTFTFAKPGVIKRLGYDDDKEVDTENVKIVSNKFIKSVYAPAQETTKIDVEKSHKSPFALVQDSTSTDSKVSHISPFATPQETTKTVFEKSHKSPFAHVQDNTKTDARKSHISPFAPSQESIKTDVEKSHKSPFEPVQDNTNSDSKKSLTSPFVPTQDITRINDSKSSATQNITKTDVTRSRKSSQSAQNVTKESADRSLKSPLSAQDIKKTAAYAELEKNSKKSSDVKLELGKSISCTDVPSSLLVKSVAREYFDQFGETLKVTVRPKRNMITVYYTTKEAASRAYKEAKSFLGDGFQTNWTTSEMLSKPRKTETIKSKIASFLNLDDEVKEELEAMQGLEYTLPAYQDVRPKDHKQQDLRTQNLKSLTAAAKAKVKKAAKVVANKDISKRTPLIKPLMKSIRSLAKSDRSQAKPEPAIKNQTIIKISSAAIEELQKQVRQMGTTSEEKYKVLDARDRLMRLKQTKQKSLASAKITRGKCPDMCPEKERYLREFQRTLSSFEQLEGTDYKINHPIAIKQYSRSSADQEEPMAHDLRPVKSLKMTMSYLLHEIADLCEEEDANLSEWYHFLWDRMRSIRKDITQQELCCLESVELVEQCARFHILASERLCAEETSVFDPKINSENLTKCLQSLKYMYYDLRENGISCENEPEFRAYIILLNLNNGTFIAELSALPPSIQHSPEVKFALEVYSALAMDNYCRFFKLVRKTTYLNGCILLRYFNQVRVKALSVMVKAYCRTLGNTEYPLYELIDILGFEDEDEVFEFISRVGLNCDRESLYIKLNKENFRAPSNNLDQGRAFNLVLSKRLSIKQAVGECIAGSFWPEKTYENHKPHNSFDANGYLLPASYNARDQGSSEADPYEFVDDDEQMDNDPKTSSASTKISNNAEEKKFLSPIRPPEPVFTPKPKPDPPPPAPKAITVPTPTTLPATKTSSNNVIFKTVEQKIFAPPSTTSIFAKPAAPIFSAIHTKPSPMPVTSPFSVTVNKSIFSGNSSQTNLFKPPTAPTPISTPESIKTNVPSNIASSSNVAVGDRTAPKRHLEDSQEVAEKKSFTKNAELVKKQLEVEAKLKAEKEKLRVLEQANKDSLVEYEQLVVEVIEEECMKLVRDELNRIKIIETLTNNAYESLLLEICEEDLGEILQKQLFVQDVLIEVERRLKDKLVLKYLRIWKQASKRRAQCREALDNTPVWLQPESVEQCARKLYHPEQKLAIKFARENKRRSLILAEEKKPKQTPIEFIIYVGLKENAKSFDGETNLHAFWKMVISWPLLENRLTLWRHKKLVNKYLSPQDHTLEPIFIEHKPSPLEKLDVCIRHFEGLICENFLTGTDGLLFIVNADEDLKLVERRLTKSILSREKLMPIPLVIVVFGDDELEPRNVNVSPVLERLLDSGYVSEYSVLFEKSVDEQVVLKVIQSAILWLAINRSPSVPLEMDYLYRLFDYCLTEELWLRIQGYLSHNPQFTKALNDPNFIINLHNEAVNHMIDIVLDPESMTYTDFAPELKIYLDKKRTYPCTYEYFDSVWKHPEYRAELERIMSSFIFPPWREAWPIHDMVELHDAITSYCCKLLPYESSLSITNNVMSDLFLIPDSGEESCPSFADVIIHIAGKKISDIGGNTRVVYNKNHIKHFQTLPWWFKSNIVVDYIAQLEDVEEPNSENENLTMSQLTTSTSQLDIDIDCDIDELSESCRQQEEELPLVNFCKETRARLTDVQSVVEKLDKQLEQQKLKSQELEARLKEALKDDVS